MKHLKLVMVAVVLAMFLSACTGTGGKTAWYDQWGACAAAGGAAGIAVGATEDFDTALAGAAGGAVIEPSAR